MLTDPFPRKRNTIKYIRENLGSALDLLIFKAHDAYCDKKILINHSYKNTLTHYKSHINPLLITINHTINTFCG